MVNFWQGFPVVTKAFMIVSDHWPADIYIYIYIHIYIYIYINTKLLSFLHLNITLNCWLSVKPSIQGKTPLREGALKYLAVCSLRYCFSFFSVIATKSLLAFSFSNASITPIPSYFALSASYLLGNIIKWRLWRNEQAS